jgi:hypothetical protein
MPVTLNEEKNEITVVSSYSSPVLLSEIISVHSEVAHSQCSCLDLQLFSPFPHAECYPTLLRFSFSKDLDD